MQQCNAEEHRSTDWTFLLSEYSVQLGEMSAYNPPISKYKFSRLLSVLISLNNKLTEFV